MPPSNMLLGMMPGSRRRRRSSIEVVPPVTCDTLFNNTHILITDADGDESGFGHAVTLNGDAALTASGIDTSGAGYAVISNVGTNVLGHAGNLDFTLEGVTTFNDVGSDQVLLDRRVGLGQNGITIWYDASESEIVVQIGDVSGTWDVELAATGVDTTAVAYAWRLSKSGSNYFLHLDGVNADTATAAITIANDDSSDWTFGANSDGSNSLDGLQQIRVTVGVARSISGASYDIDTYFNSQCPLVSVPAVIGAPNMTAGSLDQTYDSPVGNLGMRTSVGGDDMYVGAAGGVNQFPLSSAGNITTHGVLVGTAGTGVNDSTFQLSRDRQFMVLQNATGGLITWMLEDPDDVSTAVRMYDDSTLAGLTDAWTFDWSGEFLYIMDAGVLSLYQCAVPWWPSTRTLVGSSVDFSSTSTDFQGCMALSTDLSTLIAVDRTNERCYSFIMPTPESLTSIYISGSFPHELAGTFSGPWSAHLDENNTDFYIAGVNGVTIRHKQYSFPLSDGSELVPDTAVFATWDSSESSALLTFSDGDSTVSHGATDSGTYGCTRATLGRSTGKYYFEIFSPSATGAGTPADGIVGGLVSGDVDLTAITSRFSQVTPGGDPYFVSGSGYYYRRSSGGNSFGIEHNNSFSFVNYTPQGGTGRIGIAIDLDNGAIWAILDPGGQAVWVDLSSGGGTNPRDVAAGIFSWTPGQTFYPAAALQFDTGTFTDQQHTLISDPRDFEVSASKFWVGEELEGFTPGWYTT